MDYLGHQGRPDLFDDEIARGFFRRIDAEFYRAAWFAQPAGEPLFARLIDYRSLREKRVLEVGSGLGAISATLARHGARVTALDLTWTGVSSTARRFAVDGTRGSVVQGEAERLPLADGSFDFVWSWGVILHAPNPARALREMQRVLRPGGEVRVMIYNRHSFYNWLGIIARYGVLRMQLLRHSVQELWNRYSDGRAIGGCPHVGYYSPAELRSFMTAAGFEVVELRAFEQKTALTHFVPPSMRSMMEKLISDGLMHALFRRFGMLLYCRARKTGA
jgi:2-polyprenyl-3-methyl-5-hydroxy-6-metoxy-1,4-benzoquinol methylase